MAKVFKHLFSGSDSKRSLQELQRWVAAYDAKYSGTTRYTIDGDECDPDTLCRELRQRLQGASLFAEPQLLILKRLTLRTKLNLAQKRHFEDIAKLLEGIPEGMTLLIWEEHEVPIDHPLRQPFTDPLHAKLHEYQVPSEGGLTSAIRQHLSPWNVTLSSEATRWLADQYRLLGLLQKPERNKLQLADERGWWLANLLEGAGLRATIGQIDLQTLRAGAVGIIPPAAPFSITRAIASGNFSEAARAAQLFMESADERAYFGLWGALTWQLAQKDVRLPQSTLTRIEHWLAEIEILSKRGEIEPAWLLHLLIFRLSTQSQSSLVSAKTLWLSTLPV